MIIPEEALRKATPEDYEYAKKLKDKGVIRIEVPNREKVKTWMKSKGWRRSWLFPNSSLQQSLFASEENFHLAISEGIVHVHVPKDSVQITEKELNRIDRLYAQKEWDSAVVALREYRRAIDAGVAVIVGDVSFTSSGSFYTWVHKRYHILEEAANEMIWE